MVKIPAASLTFDKVHGPLFGEATENSVVVWYRDENALEEPPVLHYWAEDTPDCVFKHPLEPARAEADFTSKTKVTNLQPGKNYVYEVVSKNTEATAAKGDDDEEILRCGAFKTPGSKSVNFLFGSCIGGQGIGRYTEDHKDGPGFPIFKAMAALDPDFIQIQGDFIYADNAIERVSNSPFFKGQTFQTPDDVDVLDAASCLEGFRARYKYTLEDPALGDCLRNTIVFNTWDDHEIFDDFGQARLLDQGKSDLYKHGERAFHEYWPLSGPPEEPYRIYRKATFGPHMELFILDTRSYRAVHDKDYLAPGDTPSMKHILGPIQKRWLLDSLKECTTTWKFIATSVPLAYPTGWPRPEDTGYDGWSDGKDVSLSGPELELRDILLFIHEQGIRNVIFLSGDVHFPFAISYDPFERGEPLIYEIGSTPLHALCLPPPERGPDRSFNPTTLYADGKFADQSNLNFGQVQIDDGGNFQFNIRDIDGKSMYELKLTPK